MGGYFDDPDVEAMNIPDPWTSDVSTMMKLSTSPEIGMMNQADLMRQLKANSRFQGKALQQQLDLSKRFQPLFFEQEKAAVYQKEKAIAEMMEKYGAMFKRADESLQPEALKELGRQVLGQLQTGGRLSPGERRNFQQDARSAQQARGGLTLGAAPVAEEARLGVRERRSRQRQDWGDAQKYLGTLRGYEKDWGQQLRGGFGSTPSVLSARNVQQGMTGAGMYSNLSQARRKADYQQAVADYNAEQMSGGSSKWGKIGQIAGSVAGAFLPGGPAVWGNIGGQIGGGFDKKPSRYGATGGGGGGGGGGWDYNPGGGGNNQQFALEDLMGRFRSTNSFPTKQWN